MRQPHLLFTAIFALVALVVTGCGGSGAGEASGGPPREGAPEDTEATRVVPHAMGSTEITGQPERVIVLDTGELDSVLALGVTPVGAVRADAAARQTSDETLTVENAALRSELDGVNARLAAIEARAGEQFPAGAGLPGGWTGADLALLGLAGLGVTVARRPR